MYSHFVSEIALQQVGFRPRLLHECGTNVCCSARFNVLLVVRRFLTTLVNFLDYISQSKDM